jgi:hypothetical protein
LTNGGNFIEITPGIVNQFALSSFFFIFFFLFPCTTPKNTALAFVCPFLPEFEFELVDSLVLMKDRVFNREVCMNFTVPHGKYGILADHKYVHGTPSASFCLSLFRVSASRKPLTNRRPNAEAKALPPWVIAVTIHLTLALASKIC